MPSCDRWVSQRWVGFFMANQVVFECSCVWILFNLPFLFGDPMVSLGLPDKMASSCLWPRCIMFLSPSSLKWFARARLHTHTALRWQMYALTAVICQIPVLMCCVCLLCSHIIENHKTEDLDWRNIGDVLHQYYSPSIVCMTKSVIGETLLWIVKWLDWSTSNILNSSWAFCYFKCLTQTVPLSSLRTIKSHVLQTPSCSDSAPHPSSIFTCTQYSQHIQS